jgi:hypothetical protein
MTKQEFIQFINNLKTDFIENKKQWGNTTIEVYLEAMSRYVEDIPGYYKNTNQNIDLENINWKFFSDILKRSSIYK